jgi:cysteinyl-tRNA synthetase
MLTVFDLVQRYLRSRGYAVTYVRNITDIDDKIIQRAKENGEDWKTLANRFIAAMHEDCALLALQAPDAEPRATEYIPEIVSMTQALIDKGYAYRAQNGDVMYSVRKFPAYGALSGRRIDDARAGARVQIDEFKHDPLDFVVWKHAKDGEPAWPSPWGPGRPGWHIECSAMSAAYLGNIFDIHGGGLDLIFPHHENEIAQSRCAHGTPTMANYWMHNGFLQVEGEKMSKSLGNFFTIRELLDDWPGDALRLNMLKTHYRSPIDWTLKSLEESKKVVDSWYDIVDGQAAGEPDEGILSLLGDDLNTSGAITRLHAIAAGRMATSEQAQLDIQQTLKASANVLGLLGKTKAEYLRGDPRAVVVDDSVVRALIADRTAARARKDFKESDRIRDELAAMGVVIKDSKEGTTWEIAR